MSGTALKLVALALMLADHIWEFIPGMPMWLTWLGRLSAPLFFFCAAQGIAHTHDRKKHLLRLYICGVIMAVIDLVCNNTLEVAYVYIYNNIFLTIFSVALLVNLGEYWRRDKKRGTLYFALYIAVQLAALAAAGSVSGGKFYGLQSFAGAVLGSAVLCEGGPVWVLLGVGLYIARDNKARLAAVYIAFCVFFFVGAYTSGGGLHVLLYDNWQWMMVFALPLMLLYNGKRGAGLKYLFYVFYPAHITALFFLGNYIFFK